MIDIKAIKAAAIDSDETGLLAVERLHPKLSDHALRRASVMAQMLIQAKSGIHWCDFQQFVKE